MRFLRWILVICVCSTESIVNSFHSPVAVRTSEQLDLSTQLLERTEGRGFGQNLLNEIVMCVVDVLCKN